MLVAPRGARELRNDLADRVPVRGDRKIFVGEDVRHLEPVGVAERALEERLRHLKADEAVIRVRHVRATRDLDDVE